MNTTRLVKFTGSLAALAICSACGALRQGQDDMQPPISAPTAMTQAAAIASPRYQVLYFFAGPVAGDGSFSEAPLIDVNGTLYGTTAYGGTSGFGTVFSLSPSGTENVLYSFEGGSDGDQPEAGLTNVSGTLYGTTESGGANGIGTVFAITNTGTETVLHSFGGSGDGNTPVAGLVNVNGTLFGTTLYGGAQGAGTVFSISTTGKEKVVYGFARGTDGGQPEAALIDVKGMLYGTTYNGGLNAFGTVYRVSPTGAEKVLYSFNAGSDGRHPQASLRNVNGNLYGTTEYGGGGDCHGSRGCGTVYRVSLDGKEKVVYAFRGSVDGDGALPGAGVVDVRGRLYGTTYAGGNGQCGYPNGCGTAYSVSTTGSETVLHSFARTSTDGGKPVANLIVVNGTIYGTTEAGGKTHERCPHGCGSVFALSP
jgi:uncharacterized repeat protein (TIGR03803 family)